MLMMLPGRVRSLDPASYIPVTFFAPDHCNHAPLSREYPCMSPPHRPLRYCGCEGPF
ncbi:hypothetical protein SPHINGOAX6_70576 [Sphingomonas sp. AX6]|nr:hypothetical protein SPHINGOAX6_70576 [Sphingomonas sp. AX6]